MFWWFGDLLDTLNGRKYKTGRGLPRPSPVDVVRAYARDLTKEEDDDTGRPSKSKGQ